MARNTQPAQQSFIVVFGQLVGFALSAGTVIILAGMLLKAANENSRPEWLDPSGKNDKRHSLQSETGTSRTPVEFELGSENPDRSREFESSANQFDPYKKPKAKPGHIPIPNSSGLPSGLGQPRDDYGREGHWPSDPSENSGIGESQLRVQPY